MRFRSLSIRGLVFVCTGLLFAATLDANLLADDADWQAAGTRQRFGTQLKPKSETTDDDKARAASKNEKQTKQGEPRRFDRDVARNARPIRRVRRPGPPPSARKRAPATRVGYQSAPPVRNAPNRSNPVRKAVAVQPPSPSQSAHRTVSYHARPYPMAPWHPHPYYSAYTSGSIPGRFVSHAAQHESIVAGEIVEGPGGVLDPEPAPEVWGDGEFHEFEEGFYDDGVGYDGGYDGGYGGGCGCGEGGCGGCCGNPLFASLSFGVQGFKDAQDLGRNGNFGFQQGFELGMPAPCYPFGIQFGMRFTQNNIHGDQTTNSFRDDGHEQLFLTTGLFRRANGCCPWQYGVVFDWRHDNYWVESDQSQIRFEISRKNCWGNEFGFLMALRTGDENFHDEDLGNVNDLSDGIRPTDYYTVFWRRPTEILGEWRFMAGVTGDSGAMLGGDFWLPVGRCLGLEGEWAYLLPDERHQLGQRTDAYALGLNIVWYPYRTPQQVADHPYRPVMPVANNARFFSRLK